MVLLEELATLRMIVLVDVLKRIHSSLVSDKQKIGAALQNQCNQFKIGNVGPAGIVKYCSAVVAHRGLARTHPLLVSSIQCKRQNAAAASSA